MSPQQPANTNPSIFLKLNNADLEPREMAWDQFTARYSPIISGFARRLGCRQSDIEDVVQDVLLGFFLKSPTFVYDPSKGRFRRYLKVCTYHALQKRLKSVSPILGMHLTELDADAVSVEAVWNDVWEQELLRRAVEDLRSREGDSRSFAAFERCAVLGESPESVAESLGMHVKSVFRARAKYTQELKSRLVRLRAED